MTAHTGMIQNTAFQSQNLRFLLGIETHATAQSEKSQALSFSGQQRVMECPCPTANYPSAPELSQRDKGLCIAPTTECNLKILISLQNPSNGNAGECELLENSSQHCKGCNFEVWWSAKLLLLLFFIFY